jgi:hypothetical protein
MKNIPFLYRPGHYTPPTDRSTPVDYSSAMRQNTAMAKAHRELALLQGPPLSLNEAHAILDFASKTPFPSIVSTTSSPATSQTSITPQTNHPQQAQVHDNKLTVPQLLERLQQWQRELDVAHMSKSVTCSDAPEAVRSRIVEAYEQIKLRIKAEELQVSRKLRTPAPRLVQQVTAAARTHAARTNLQEQGSAFAARLRERESLECQRLEAVGLEESRVANDGFPLENGGDEEMPLVESQEELEAPESQGEADTPGSLRVNAAYLEESWGLDAVDEEEIRRLDEELELLDSSDDDDDDDEEVARLRFRGRGLGKV